MVSALKMFFDAIVDIGFDGGLESIPVEKISEHILSMARLSQSLGYHSFWVYDHYLTQRSDRDTRTLESWLTLAALAHETIPLGILVSCVGFRNPALLAKMASTLDVLTKGRFTLGLGAGWYQEEFESYGYRFLSASERIAQLEEAVQIILALLTQDNPVTFDGQYYQLRNAVNQPKGIQKPHVPLFIGGSGEKLTLRLVAQYSDRCNLFGSPSDIARKLSVLEQHCKAVGRDYYSIKRTLNVRFCSVGSTYQEAVSQLRPNALQTPNATALVGTVTQIRELLDQYADVGIEGMAIQFVNEESMQRFAEAFLR